MKKSRIKLLTLLIGVVVAISAISFGIGMIQSNEVIRPSAEAELPSVDLIDLNKVFYIFFHK